MSIPATLLVVCTSSVICMALGYRLGQHAGIRWTLDQMRDAPGYEAVFLYTLARMRGDTTD